MIKFLTMDRFNLIDVFAIAWLATVFRDSIVCAIGGWLVIALVSNILALRGRA